MGGRKRKKEGRDDRTNEGRKERTRKGRKVKGKEKKDGWKARY